MALKQDNDISPLDYRSSSVMERECHAHTAPCKPHCISVTLRGVLLDTRPWNACPCLVVLLIDDRWRLWMFSRAGGLR